MEYKNLSVPRPDNGYKPSGFLGGMWSMRDRNRYDDMSAVQDYMTGLEAKDSQAKLADYLYAQKSRRSGYDLTDAGNRSKLDTPGYQASARSGEMGLNQTQAAAGMHDSMVLPSRVAASISNNEQVPDTNRTLRETNETTRQSQPGLRSKALSEHIDRAAALFGTDLQGQTAYAQFRATMPPELQQAMPPTYGPAAEQRIKQIREVLTREHTQKLAEIKAQGDQTARTAGIYADSRASIAAAKNPATMDAVTRFEMALQKGNKDAIESLGNYLLDTADLAPQEKQAIQAAAARAGVRLNVAQAARMQPPILPNQPGLNDNVRRIQELLDAAKRQQGGGGPQRGTAANPIKLD